MSLRVADGQCHALFAFDIGKWIDLEKCGRLLARPTRPGAFVHRHRAPPYFQFEHPPLRVELEPAPSGAAVACLFYDFGAVSLSYTAPADGGPDELVALGEQVGSEDDARARVQVLLEAARDAVEAPEIAPVVEDYLVYQVGRVEPALPPAALLDAHPQDLARILRAETTELGPDEVKDAIGARISFGPDDLALVDWNGAILLGGDEDERAVLEYLNVQLLELRLLDRQLDRSLDQAYEAVTRPPRTFLASASRAHMGRIGQMQVDLAILYERVANALKLLGDQYLARLYRLGAQRFHLAAWEASVRRKLETIESIYQKMFDRAATHRLEMLEWLIIVLIAAGIILPYFLP